MMNFPDQNVPELSLLNIFRPVSLTRESSLKSAVIADYQLSVEIDQLADHVWPGNEQSLKHRKNNPQCRITDPHGSL